MKPTRDDMSARKQADCVTRAYAAVWSAELFGSGLDVIDCTSMVLRDTLPEAWVTWTVLIVNVEALSVDDVHHRTPVQIMQFFSVRRDEVSRPEQLTSFWRLGPSSG